MHLYIHFQLIVRCSCKCSDSTATSAAAASGCCHGLPHRTGNRSRDCHTHSRSFLVLEADHSSSRQSESRYRVPFSLISLCHSVPFENAYVNYFALQIVEVTNVNSAFRRYCEESHNSLRDSTFAGSEPWRIRASTTSIIPSTARDTSQMWSTLCWTERRGRSWIAQEVGQLFSQMLPFKTHIPFLFKEKDTALLWRKTRNWFKNSQRKIIS